MRGCQRVAVFSGSKASALLLAIAAGLASPIALADNFSDVHYEARGDQLVVTMLYRGTNPDHTFSVTWGPCKDGKSGRHEIEANVLDSQWQDAAQRKFRKTTHFSLADLNCRPAKLTLRTAPRFYYTVQIPARSIQTP
jgi:hypothetical protein